MNTLINQLIHAYRGYGYEAAGVISAFFADARQASACATRLRALVNANVESCGTQMTVWL